MSDEPHEVWWPAVVGQPATADATFELTYQPLPDRGYDEPTPSRCMFDERAAQRLQGLLGVRDKEIRRLKMELSRLAPETSGAAAALRRKREKLRRKSGLAIE